MADQVDSLSDSELCTKLAVNGFPVMPITASTRPLLVQKLKVVLNNKTKLKDSGDNRRSIAAGEEAIVETAGKRRKHLFEMADQVDSLSDAELCTKLVENGFPVMPITASTRPLLVQKLKVIFKNKTRLKDSGDNRRSIAAGEETIVKRAEKRRKHLFELANQVDSLSDADLCTKLAENGFPVVPITASTRPLLVQKLKAALNNKTTSKDSGDNRSSLAAGEETIVKIAKTETVKESSNVTAVSPQASSRMLRMLRRTVGKNAIPTTVESDSIINRDHIGGKHSKDENNSAALKNNEKGFESESEQQRTKTPSDEEEDEYMDWE